MPVLSAARIQELRDKVRGLHVEEKLIRFITAIVAATRNHKSIYLGASPRASIGILNGSKALAAMRGRDFVTPDDIVYTVPGGIASPAGADARERRWKGLPPTM